MRLNALLIVSLILVVIAAPVVDAIACDDCNDIIPLQDMQQRLTNGVDHSDGRSLLSENGHPSPQGAAAAQDLCPVCANIAAAIVNVCCSAPNVIGQASHLPRLIALSGPSYSINKPPQN
jgi:hypothetical protein